jgi:predicted ABC-class ATPase
MPSHQDLQQQLFSLEGQSYKAYKELWGRYEFPNFTLFIDRVQGDPFAAPSQCRVRVPNAKDTAIPQDFYRNDSREIALRDFLTRAFHRASQDLRQRRGSGKSGLIAILQPGQAVLERSSVVVNDGFIEARFVVGLPAFGRRIAGQQAAELLCHDLPQLVDRALCFQNLDVQALQQHVETAEDADYIRNQLPKQKLVAFIANGSILPRQSGISDRPLQEAAIAFRTPPSLQAEFTCPNRGLVRGMGIPAGVTLIVGGGYHGKSTVLRAIERGIHNHVPGDGREYAITEPTAVKIRAEDGRSIQRVDISPFINHLPQGRSTTQFSTSNASGSTSQAANIIEALEAGSKLLLLDEDTCATNFMIRDRRMQALVAKENEPITPFIDKVRQLHTEYGVSTILVMGGSGDYLDVADTVIALHDFQPQDVTNPAKEIAKQFANDRAAEGGHSFGRLTPRVLPVELLQSDEDDRKGDRIKAFETNKIVLGRQEIEVSFVEQLIEEGQLRAIGAALLQLRHRLNDNGSQPLPDLLNWIEQQLNDSGLDALTPYPDGSLVHFRRFELAAALNRLRPVF